MCLQKGACQVLSRFADVPSLTTRASWVCGRSSLTPGAHRCACAVQVLAAQASGWSRHRRRANGRRPFGAQPAGVARRSMPKKKSAHVEEAAAPDAAAPAHAAAEAHKPKKKQHAAAEAADAAAEAHKPKKKQHAAAEAHKPKKKKHAEGEAETEETQGVERHEEGEARAETEEDAHGVQRAAAAGDEPPQKTPEAAPARLPAGEVEYLDSDRETNAAAEKQPVPKAYLYAPSAAHART